jgi:Immunoglobulin domain
MSHGRLLDADSRNSHPPTRSDTIAFTSIVWPAALVVAVCFCPCVRASDVDAALNELRRTVRDARVVAPIGRVQKVYNARLSIGASPQQSVDAFLDKHMSILGASRSTLVQSSTHQIVSGKFTLITYQQFVIGIPVYDSWLRCLVRNRADHPLVLINSSLRRTAGVPTTPRITKRSASRSARVHQPEIRNVQPANLVYYPTGIHDVTLSWRVFADNGRTQDRRQWEVIVDATTGQVIDSRPSEYHAEIGGVVMGYRSPSPLPDQPDNPPQRLPVFGARLRLDDDVQFADEIGQFLFDDIDANAGPIDLDLNGQWCDIRSDDGEGELTATLDIDPPNPADFTLNGGLAEVVTAQLNAIVGVTRMHDFIKDIQPAFDQIDTPLLTVVNVDDTCNAAYSFDNPRLTFFRSGDGCPNTAYASVVHHEYGHFAIDKAPGGPDGFSYHEGMADTLASIIDADPCIAPDFFGVGEGCLRDISTSTIRFPCATLGSHTCGQSLAGAFWKMRQYLIESEGPETGTQLARDYILGQLLTGQHQLSPGITLELLALDDDDDNILNGTPHFHDITIPFAEHGFPGPTVVFNDGDFDGDGDIDLSDYTLFFDCARGPNEPIADSCDPADFDGDGDIDLQDFRRVSSRFSGDCGARVTRDPQDVVGCFGEIAELTMAGEGQDIEYVWTFNGQQIYDAKSPSLTIDPIAPDSIGTYVGFVVGGCVVDVTEPAVISTPDPPSLVTLPESVTTCIGDTVSFTVDAIGFGPLEYVWLLNGEEIATLDSPTLVVSPVSADDAGDYSVIVFDRCGVPVVTEDSPATLDFIPPEIMTQPQLFITCEGLTAEFEIEAIGFGVVTYQWQFEGQDIPGATSPVLTIDSVTDDDLGQYSCVVSDDCGSSVTSWDARLKYGEVVIDSQPQGGKFCAGSLVFLIAAAPGGDTFQWFKDGQPIEGEESFLLSLVDIAIEDAGSYQLHASSLCNDVTTEPVAVDVVNCAVAR